MCMSVCMGSERSALLFRSVGEMLVRRACASWSRVRICACVHVCMYGSVHTLMHTDAPPPPRLHALNTAAPTRACYADAGEGSGVTMFFTRTPSG